MTPGTETPPVGAVFTPLPCACKTILDNRIYKRWREGAVILDPTAGSGNFLEAFILTAKDRKDPVTPDLLKNLYAVEMEQIFIDNFHRNMELNYAIDFPRDNFLRGDYLFTSLPVQADILLGNPPWLNFCDLREEYKERLKPLFIESGLGGNRNTLLLGNSRIDIAALIVVEAMRKNLKAGGKAFFYLPLSLFLGDGAHGNFRKLLNDGEISIDRIDDYRRLNLFPGVSTRYGFAGFTKGEKTRYPLKYTIIGTDGKKQNRKASPIDGDRGPLVIFDSKKPETLPVIALDRKSKPRQGLNTCGANGLFLFEHREPAGKNLSLLVGKNNSALLPDDLIFPLIGSGQFKEGDSSHRHVFLPYSPSGKVLTVEELSRYPEAETYLRENREFLEKRKGVLIGSAIAKGLWWSLLGVGPYSFAPWKIVWEAYGRREFRPRLFSSENGKPWQPNQALQAYIPAWNEGEAREILNSLKNPAIGEILRSQGMEGTCNWAQPGRIMKFIKFRNGD